jgi:hypothetical protein
MHEPRKLGRGTRAGRMGYVDAVVSVKFVILRRFGSERYAHTTAKSALAYRMGGLFSFEGPRLYNLATHRKGGKGSGGGHT